MTRRLGLAATIAAAALALAACSGGGATTAPATQAPASQAPASQAPASAPPSEGAASGAATCEVVAGATGTAAEIKGFAFPAGLTVKAGDAITWSNGDSAPHTVTFDDGTCASGNIAGGASVTVSYTVAGSYPFHCAIHPQMTGTLEVSS
jgi:plastocyanin